MLLFPRDSGRNQLRLEVALGKTWFLLSVGRA